MDHRDFVIAASSVVLCDGVVDQITFGNVTSGISEWECGCMSCLPSSVSHQSGGRNSLAGNAIVKNICNGSIALASGASRD